MHGKTHSINHYYSSVELDLIKWLELILLLELTCVIGNYRREVRRRKRWRGRKCGFRTTSQQCQSSKIYPEIYSIFGTLLGDEKVLLERKFEALIFSYPLRFPGLCAAIQECAWQTKTKSQMLLNKNFKIIIAENAPDVYFEPRVLVNIWVTLDHCIWEKECLVDFQ